MENLAWSSQISYESKHDKNCTWAPQEFSHDLRSAQTSNRKVVDNIAQSSRN